MYLNDLNSSQHNVKKLNRILADTFKHDVDLSEMSTDSLNRMLTTTNSKMMEIKESNLKYWENPQYNKLGLIAHQIKTYLSEIAPTRSDGKKMKKESKVMEADLDQAEVLLAAQELVDELQKMVEDVAEMQVQKLMPIVDAMKEQIGFDVAEAYNNAADAALGGLLDQMKGAKTAVENATLAARGEPVPGGEAVPTDMGMTDADMDPEAPMDADAGMDMPADEFGGDETEAGEDNAVGRELKGESALADMEGKALAEKKFLESKDKLFKMVESGQMSQEHFINVINELDEGFYSDTIEPALKKGEKFFRHKIINPAAKGVASVLDKGADVARFVGDHAKIDDPYVRDKYLTDPKFRKAHKLSKGNFGAPPASAMVPPVDTNELPQPMSNPEPTPKPPVPMDMMSPALQKRFKNKRMAPPIATRDRQKIGDSAVKEKKNKYGVEINPYWDKFRQDNEGRPMELQGGDDSDLRGFDSAEERDRILDIIKNQGKNRGPETYPKSDRPINRFAPPPTGPGGDEALPRSKQPKRRPERKPAPRPRNRFAPPPTGPGGDQALPKMKKPDLPSGPTYGGQIGGTLPAPPGLPGGDPLIHGGKPKVQPKAKPSGPGLPKGDPMLYSAPPKAKPVKKSGPVTKAFA